jgi:transposase
MSMKCGQHSAQSRAMMALEMVKECRTVNEFGTECGVHPTQISQWKRQLLEGPPELFSRHRRKQAHDEEVLQTGCARPGRS